MAKSKQSCLTLPLFCRLLKALIDAELAPNGECEHQDIVDNDTLVNGYQNGKNMNCISGNNSWIDSRFQNDLTFSGNDSNSSLAPWLSFAW